MALYPMSYTLQLMRPLKQTPSIIEGTSEKIGVDIEQAKRDKALALLAAQHVEFDYDSPESKAVLRKIDLRIIPMVLSVYVMMLVDKNSLSFANIMGVKESTGVTASQYSWLGSVV
ncbi:hypothetical protein N0V83_002426 [Neocucurbitaria cava]|uniref:Uncharacterized protein n=1 Tax=Neocucurbitaria cava TaxID=798079 RepID=A0A9W8YE12_9PLEO|nr:hypothetical protein N0V83_002426 [Neocucurbitaria cava]